MILNENKSLEDTYEDNMCFRLLCRYKPNQVVNFLKRKTYNINDVKIVLEEFNHLRGLGYMFFKSGEE